MAELLKATKKMTKDSRRLLEHIPMHSNINDHYQNNTSTSHSDKYKHKPHYHKDEVNEIISDTSMPKQHQPKLMTHQATLI